MTDPTDDPYARNSVVVDLTNAVLLDYSSACQIHTTAGDAYALELQGRINHTDDRANALFVMDTDGIAAIISELLGLQARAGDAAAAELIRDLKVRLHDMPT